MKKTMLLWMLCCLPKLMAQQAVDASGGNATGIGGTVSYSIGQSADKTQTGTTGTVTQGVQQPFEIVALSGEDFTAITLKMVVYPNPTTSSLQLKITNSDLENLSFQLFDIKGKLLNQAKINSEITTFSLESLPKAAYLLRVMSNTSELKTFKIIKN